MLSTLKEDGFFEKRDAILAKARECGYEELWYMVPTSLAFLDREAIHLLSTFQPRKHSSAKQENQFLEALLNQHHLTTSFVLHNKNALEETAIITPRKANMMKARLQSLIPFEKLLPDAPLEEQERISLEFSSVDVINARLDAYEKEFEQTPISASAAPLNPEQPIPISGAAHEKPPKTSGITQKNFFQDQQETSPTKRIRKSHESDPLSSPEKNASNR